VWSEIESVEVLARGRVRIGPEDVPVGGVVGRRVILFRHMDGSHSVLERMPQKGALPVVLFTNRPRPNEPLPPLSVSF
jgi:hypothetical protein